MTSWRKEKKSQTFPCMLQYRYLMYVATLWAVFWWTVLFLSKQAVIGYSFHDGKVWGGAKSEKLACSLI